MIRVIVAMAAALGAAHASEHPDRICKKITYTGSRLGAVSICKTKQQWDEQQWEHDHLLRERQMIDRALNNNG